MCYWWVKWMFDEALNSPHRTTLSDGTDKNPIPTTCTNMTNDYAHSPDVHAQGFQGNVTNSTQRGCIPNMVALKRPQLTSPCTSARISGVFLAQHVLAVDLLRMPMTCKLERCDSVKWITSNLGRDGRIHAVKVHTSCLRCGCYFWSNRSQVSLFIVVSIMQVIILLVRQHFIPKGKELGNRSWSHKRPGSFGVLW